MNKIEYKPGQKLGMCTYLKEVQRKDKTRRRALFRCDNCEDQNEFEANIQDVKTGNTNSCGCYNIESSINGATKHGLRCHKLYPIWRCMKQRCYKPRDDRYKYYGARGITIYPEWMDSFEAFYDYVTELPNYGKDGYSLDRRENDGNYEPGNMRWATQHDQVANRGKLKTNTSGFNGVTKVPSGKYIAVIGVNYAHIHLGTHSTAKEAAKARDKYIIDNGLNEYPLSGL